MKTVELVKGVHSSVLGFGCAPIMGAVEPGKARVALHNAFDCGITHLDLARSYGFGQAEEFVGKLIKGRRQELVLASKFGIETNWKARLLTPAKPLVWFINRKLKKHNPEQPTIDKKVVSANHFFKRVELSGKKMRYSLEKSLRALRTDYLDYFFIHEPPEKIFFIEDLILTAEKLKAEGKIRAVGLAFMREQEELHKSYLSSFDVLQFDNSPGAPGYQHMVTERGNKPNIIFSPLRGGSNLMKPTEKLQKLAADFPNTVILCSMFTESHLKQNTALFKG